MTETCLLAFNFFALYGPYGYVPLGARNHENENFEKFFIGPNLYHLVTRVQPKVYHCNDEIHKCIVLLKRTTKEFIKIKMK